jgi:hypothetical protein
MAAASGLDRDKATDFRRAVGAFELSTAGPDAVIFKLLLRVGAREIHEKIKG